MPQTHYGTSAPTGSPMTDSHSNTPQPSSMPAAQSGSQYEGFDPELPEHDKTTGKTAKVSTVQVGASAAAAVTSALCASFFGVAGTLIGAAVGSIVSTVAGAFYAEYLRRASTAVRNTTTVVVQRIPPEKLATSALRKLVEPAANAAPGRAVDPAAVPPTQSLRPVDAENADETVVVPVESGTELLAAADGTRVMPATTIEPPPAAPVDPPRSWWRRPVVGLALVGLAGFTIALAVITAAEGFLGHPFSGGTGGTTLSRISDKPVKDTTPTPTSTVTVTETETVTPSASATEQPSATRSVAPTATQAPTATTEPTATATVTQAPSATEPPATADEVPDAAGPPATAAP
jgi:hypothetical protein